MPVASPVAIGVCVTVHVRPPSLDRSIREAVVPIHTRSPLMAMFVPLAANAPSPSSAGGSASAGIRSHVAPPFDVRRITNRPSTESLNANPRFTSPNVIASRKTLGSVFLNCSTQ